MKRKSQPSEQEPSDEQFQGAPVDPVISSALPGLRRGVYVKYVLVSISSDTLH